MKVLYTFDDENKTNCLARWPQPLDIRTAYLNENTQVGVIELKTCIQAIVSASPELVAKLGQDYTVYAYDYSEYETPLVGQGMLSWVLASSSSTPAAPAHQSRTVVTGRVCKNLLGLFSSGSQETLEVKLRLVPVPTCLQSEYLESMKKYRDISRIMPEGFDAGAWTSFIQSNPAILQAANQSRSQSPAVGPGQKDKIGIEHVQRLLSEGSMGDAGSQRLFSKNPSYSSIEGLQQLPRAASPASSIQSATTAKRRGRPPRSASSVSTRGRGVPRKDLTRRESIDSGFASNDERFEEGPAKKRAKVMKADWPSKTGLGSQSDSLRVAASAAASVRIHQPTAVRPMANTVNSLEGPPRLPTPIAEPSNIIRRPLLPAPQSHLRRESVTMTNSKYKSPYPPSEGISKPSDSAMTSPEQSRIGSDSNTPPDIPSSPPVYRGVSTAPSSPRLPTMSRDVDSGFMSGSIDDLFEDDEDRPLDDEDLEMAAQYSKRQDLPTASNLEDSVVESSVTSLDPDRPQQPDHKTLAQIRMITGHTSESHPLSRTASSGALPTLAVPASDPVRPSNLYRSQTWSGMQALYPASDAPTAPRAPEVPERPNSRGRPGSGAGARRKKAIQTRLETSIAAGEMPPFCENCGAIETPTWRKAWVKLHSGTPEHVRISEEEGGIVAWQTLQTDENGVINLYRIIKKTVLATDEGFTEILLCNRKSQFFSAGSFTNLFPACGLWLHTRKCMRPKEFWEKNPSQRGPHEKRKRAPRARKQDSEAASNHAASDASHGTALHSDASSPPDGANQEEGAGNTQLPPAKRQRASSVQIAPTEAKGNTMSDATAAVALQRAIQSSPARFIGTQNIPIEVEDLTPKPTRRLLFPSPSQSEEGRTLRDHDFNTENKVRDNSQRSTTTPSSDLDQADKENRPPVDEEEGVAHLLTENDGRYIPRPTTPTPRSKLGGSSFKTPQKSTSPIRTPKTSDLFSSAARALLRPTTTPKRTPTKSSSQPLAEMTPFTAHLNSLLAQANNGSPPYNNLDFPSLPSLDNSPSQLHHNFDFSQFDPQDFLSTDAAMPSSPPAWFGLYVDPVEQDSGLWSDYQLPAASPPTDETGAAKGPKTPGLTVDENGHATIKYLIPAS